MRYKFTLLFILITLFSLAQMWCPPGATWKYTFYGYLSNGYTELDYVADTVIQTKTCKKIEQRFKGNYLFVSTTNTVDIHINNHFTYENNKVVYIYSYGFFDTLFNFNASIGDKWRTVTHPGGSSCWASNRKLAEVMDTGSVTINTVKLRRLAIKYLYSVPMSTNTITNIDTVYEKIGSKKSFLFPFWCETMIIDPDFSVYGQPFRCYSDNLFGSCKANGLTYCDFILEAKENEEINKDGFIYPNPVISQVNLNLKGQLQPGKIIIYNSLGQKVLESEIKDEIDVSAFPRGIYQLYYDLENRGSKNFKFIKE